MLHADQPKPLIIDPAPAARFPRLHRLVAFAAMVLERYPWAVATLGFVSGAASFFLVEREQEKFAQMVSCLMIASWMWLALEKLLRRGIAHWFGFQLPPPVLSFATQLVHQESLFFVIPFFFITTAWNTGQVIFTSFLILFALVSIIDPIYYRWLAARRWLYFIFHAITLFAVLLTALPILFHLPTPKAYLYSLAAAILLALPGLVRTLHGTWWSRALSAVALIALTAGIGIYTRTWIPPATLRLTKVAITDHIDNKNRSPKREFRIISEQQLKNGLIAYTAIRAPRGLRERIYHEWRLNGRTVDRIALDINGGREEGYRAWTRKFNFPPYPTGRWEIHVLTEANQVIGILRFQVVQTGGASQQTVDKPSVKSQDGDENSSGSQSERQEVNLPAEDNISPADESAPAGELSKKETPAAPAEEEVEIETELPAESLPPINSNSPDDVPAATETAEPPEQPSAPPLSEEMGPPEPVENTGE